MKTPYIVFFQSYIYGMECKVCDRMGEPRIDQIGANFFCDKFRIWVEDIMKNREHETIQR